MIRNDDNHRCDNLLTIQRYDNVQDAMMMRNVHDLCGMLSPRVVVRATSPAENAASDRPAVRRHGVFALMHSFCISEIPVRFMKTQVNH